MDLKFFNSQGETIKRDQVTNVTTHAMFRQQADLREREREAKEQELLAARVEKARAEWTRRLKKCEPIWEWLKVNHFEYSLASLKSAQTNATEQDLILSHSPQPPSNREVEGVVGTTEPCM